MSNITTNFAGYPVSVLILNASLNIATWLTHTLLWRLLHIFLNTTLKSIFKNTTTIKSSQSSHSEEKKEPVESKRYFAEKYFTPPFVNTVRFPVLLQDLFLHSCSAWVLSSHCFSSCIRVQPGTAIWHIADNILTY